MNVNFSKLNQVLIEDDNGQIIESFQITGAELVKSKLTGNTLTLRKK